MLIATWNVNSIRARLTRVVEWLAQHQPDIVCLQETKVVDEQFPREPLEDQGYNVLCHGQKTYNGVAILSRQPVEDVIYGFEDDDPNAERRVLGGVIGDWMVLDLYVPNGKSVGHKSYHDKLAWLQQVHTLVATRFDCTEKVAVVGDFNITFDDRDVYDPAAWHEQIHCSTPERAALAKLLDLGLHDGLRHFHEEPGIYTWWDFRTRGFERKQGLRIDHILLSEPALNCCRDIEVDLQARAGPGPSDHAPLLARFE